MAAAPSHVTAWMHCAHEDCANAKPVCRVCCKMEPEYCQEHCKQHWEQHDGFWYHSERQRDDRGFLMTACAQHRLCTKCRSEEVAAPKCARHKHHSGFHHEESIAWQPCKTKAENPDDWCGKCLGWGRFTGVWQCQACEEESKQNSVCANCREPSINRYYCAACDKMFCPGCSAPSTMHIGYAPSAGTALIVQRYCAACARSGLSASV